MQSIANMQISIRRFFRKYDQILLPVFRFIGGILLFLAIRNLFGYSEVMGRGLVIFLMAVLSALLPEGFTFFLMGVVVAVDCFTVSVETGVVFLVFFFLIYCLYVRFFPQYAYAIFLTLICCFFHVPYAAPVLVGLLAGIGGAIPAACAGAMYSFSESVRVVSRLEASEVEESQLKAVETLADAVLKNKDLYSIALVFAVVVLVIGIIKQLSFPYSSYVAIVCGIAASLLLSLAAGSVFHITPDLANVLAGTLIGGVLAVLICLGKGTLDYQKTEYVQYEDDDYYYYVKAVPKMNSERNMIERHMPAAGSQRGRE